MSELPAQPKSDLPAPQILNRIIRLTQELEIDLAALGSDLPHNEGELTVQECLVQAGRFLQDALRRTRAANKPRPVRSYLDTQLHGPDPR